MSRFGQRTRVGQAVSQFGQPIVVAALNFFEVDYLVVAGGGGGGAGYYGGGGGAGGLRSTVTATGGGGTIELAALARKATNYTVTVGAGGAGQTDNDYLAAYGNNSVYDSITSIRGGGGHSRESNVTATVAGSTGGMALTGTVGPATANQGFAGGANAYGSGGGGAGAVGGNAGGAIGANGGVGVAVAITGSSVYYGGGGGGGGSTVGGNGGGGASGDPSVAGTANTGGGGGAGSDNAAAGAAGGSGVVILRYVDTLTITIGAGLTGTESASSGGYKRATITAGTGNVSWA